MPRANGWSRIRGRAIVPVFFGLAVLAFAAAGFNPEDWAGSPEAAFLTKQERGEWKTLDSRDSRQKFIERYWLKRDPSPGTDKNEFREMVLGRIKTADERFSLEKTPGSRTARGLVFLILGSPSRVQDQRAPPPPPEAGPYRRIGQGVTPVAVNEGNETTSTWFYEPDRTPRILEVLRRPSLQIRIVVEPSRHLDSIQDPGLFDELREVVARASIANPDLVPPASAIPVVSDALLPRQALPAEVRRLLQAPPAISRKDGALVGSAVVFRESGEPETLLWMYTSRAPGQSVFHALVRTEDERELATVSEPAAVSQSFSLHTPGMVALRRLALPPGSYNASIGLTDGAGKPSACAAVPLQVPELEKGFAVSSLILTRGPAQAGPRAEAAFTFGGTTIPPRADAAFSPSESLWYFFEVANPADAAKVMLEPRLRRGGRPLAASPPFAARLQAMGVGSRRFLAGVEMPLATLGEGDYVLYLTLRDGDQPDSPSVLRRADFQVSR